MNLVVLCSECSYVVSISSCVTFMECLAALSIYLRVHCMGVLNISPVKWTAKTRGYGTNQILKAGSLYTGRAMRHKVV